MKETLPEFTVTRVATIEMYTKVRAKDADEAQAIAEKRGTTWVVGEGDARLIDDETEWAPWADECPALGEIVIVVRSAEPDAG